ncbi:hypothetical protein [Labrys sp. 22185]|uniref:hypothetical protein n=1 Tax=Labrys sp. 22185 TaxID=3453888 RepID=UPI003F86728A
MVNFEMTWKAITLAILPCQLIASIYGKDARHFPYFSPLEDGSRWWEPLDEDIDASQAIPADFVYELENLAKESNLKKASDLLFHGSDWKTVIDLTGEVPIVKFSVDSFDFLILIKIANMCDRYNLCLISASNNNVISSNISDILSKLSKELLDLLKKYAN